MGPISTEVIAACDSIQDLQDLVDAGLWVGNVELQWAIQRRFEEIVNEQNTHSCSFRFEHPSFNDILSDLEQDEQMDIDHQDGGEQMDINQQGGGAVAAVQHRRWDDHCTMSTEFEQKVKRFNVTGRAFKVSFKDLEGIDDLESFLNDMFTAMLERGEVEENDLVGFEIRHPKLDTPILISFRRKEEHTVEHISRTIEKVLQSNQELKLDDGLVCQVTKVKQPRGEGRKRTINTGNIDDFVDNHRGVIDVPGGDSLCLPRALVTSIAHVDNDPQWNTIKRGDAQRCTLQLKRAKELMEQAELQDHVGAWGLREVQTFQNLLKPHYQIKIYEKASCSGLLYSGPPANKILNLVLHEEHFMVITKIKAFLNVSYFCDVCNVTFDHLEDHRCEAVCPCCFQTSKCSENAPVKCNDCRRWMNGPKCFDQHKQQQLRVGPKMQQVKSVCQRIQRCAQCKMEYQTRFKHECNTKYCKYCKSMVQNEDKHECFMASYKPKKGQAKSYIFFDFETQQVTPVGENKYGSLFHHEPICVIVHKVCVDCWTETNMMRHCNNCGQHKIVFIGGNVLDDFVKWLFSECNRDCIAMAHNNKGYDCQFILESLYRNAVVCPEVIYKGLEIMKLKLNGVTILDSLCFLPMPLKAMPSAFGLNELKKGYFPHYFSSLDKMDYVGPIPDAYFYGPGQMKQKDKEKFFLWYFANKHVVFNFKQELEDYCNSDVDILKMAAMRFRDTFIEKTGLDPYWNSITISDACMKVFRSKFLREHTIGLIPLGEYRSNDRYSAIAMKWLRWIMHIDHIDIRHALNGGEVCIRANGKLFKVDGLCGKTVYEFYGCAFHGCPKCFGANTMLPLKKCRAKDAYQETLDRKAAIENQGYTVVEMWECTLKREMNLNRQMREFIGSQNIVEPIKAREAYFGGRTNCTKLYHKIEADETIQYIDICSLYPYVLKYGVFPCGHPNVITENFKDLSQKPYQGLIKCRVVAPKQLYHPVLPSRVHEKLMFPLCNSCAQLKQRGSCSHTPDERSFWGTWVTLELYKAMECGYKVLEISEVWDYGENVMQYHQGHDVAEGLFTEYINEFLRSKQEASDWPKSCKMEEDKVQYVQEYMRHEGVELDSSNIRKNPALRALSKLCLNSFYGKFGQRNNMTKTKCFSEPKDFFELLADTTIEVLSIRGFGEDNIQVSYVQADGFEDELPSVNVVVAAYVTAQARLKLYAYLERLQESVLYFDTDSIVYCHKPPMTKIETGSYLGDMTDELEDYGEGAYIKEFVSAGPKNYAFAVHCPDGRTEHVVKIRGFTLDSTTSKRLNMETLKRKVHKFVEHGEKEQTTVVRIHIVRSKECHLYTAEKPKTYSVVVDKRWVDDDFKSYPYGY